MALAIEGSCYAKMILSHHKRMSELHHTESGISLIKNVEVEKMGQEGGNFIYCTQLSF